MSVIAALKEWKQVNREFKSILGYTESLRLWGLRDDSMVRAFGVHM